MHRLIHASHTTFRTACPQARTAVRATGGNGDGGPADTEGDSQTAVVVAPVEPALKRPRRYHVVILNDDYTPMEFVIDVLERFFGLNVEQATVLMLQVHHQGRAAVGNYSRDVAETKAAMVVDHARQHEHPLLCQAEPVP